MQQEDNVASKVFGGGGEGEEREWFDWTCKEFKMVYLDIENKISTMLNIKQFLNYGKICIFFYSHSINMIN